MIQAIVFDFDGIIADTEPLHYEAICRVLRPLGVSFDYERYLQTYVGFADRDLIERVHRERGLPLDSAQLTRLVTRKSRAFGEVVAEGVRPCPGVMELIRQARGQLPLAICSGALRSDVDQVLPSLDGDLGTTFSTLVTADDVAASKPDPSSYLLATRRLGRPPAQCLAIEDTVPGIDAARAAGLHTLAVANTHPVASLARADRVVESLEGVGLGQLQEWFGAGTPRGEGRER